MSEVERQDHGSADTRSKPLRAALYGAVALQGLLWLYLIVTIAQHSNPMGDGMEWVAVMPASIILALGVGPALVLGRERRLLLVSVLMACGGVIFGAAFLFEIVREFAEAAAR